MSSRLCHICGKVADRTCSMCGRPVCIKDYDVVSGMCASCRSGRRIGTAARKAG
jgi:hypothetical protein